MPADVIGLLQGVKQAEEEKARAIQAARDAAAVRIRQAESILARVEDDVRERLAAEEPRIRDQVTAQLRREEQALEAWHKQRQESLRTAATRNADGALSQLCRWFQEESTAS